MMSFEFSRLKAMGKRLGSILGSITLAAAFHAFDVIKFWDFPKLA